ncbi:MAG: HAD-IA family hydrolase, partial [Smithella sp.]
SEKEIIPFKEKYTSKLIQYEAGYLSTDDFLSGLCSLFTNNFSINCIEKAFSCIIREQIAGMIEFIRYFSSRCETALVSNTNEIHYNLCLTSCKSLQLLQKHYLSYQMLAVKPSFQFYEAIIKDQKALPSELLFIDDSPENVEAAKAAGMITVQFKNIDQLKIALVNEGFL